MARMSREGRGEVEVWGGRLRVEVSSTRGRDGAHECDLAPLVKAVLENSMAHTDSSLLSRYVM